jgi:alpha-D-ribose 1-methylphosphonate 5-triphosphate synthase subunit PhnG
VDYSQVVAEGSIEAVRKIGERAAAELPVSVIKPPEAGMLMVRHDDPLQHTPFFLGEAYVTECEVEVDGRHGYGCCLGQDDERALCAAIVDAVVGSDHPFTSVLAPLLQAEERAIAARWLAEEQAAATTKVDFEVR